jgi:hypothetical protein
MQSTRSRHARQARTSKEDGVVAGAETGIADTLARLQRSAGNRAVSALIARDDAKEQASETDARTVEMPKPIGTLELLSFGRDGSNVNVVVSGSAADPLLIQAAAEGRLFDQVTIRHGTLTITLKSVVISHAAPGSGDTISLSFNFGTYEQDYTKKRPEGMPVSPS